MPASDYQVRVYAPDGVTEIAYELNSTLIDYVNRIHEVGLFQINAQAKEFNVANYRELAADSRVVVWRKPTGMRFAYKDFSGFGRAIRLTQGGQELQLAVKGFAQNELLDRAIVDAPSGDADASKDEEADDMAKAIVREQLGEDATDSDRDRSGAGFTVQDDVTLGTSIKKEFARRNVLEVLQEIHDASLSVPATAVWWGFVPTGEGLTAEFQTKIGSWGQDQTELITFSLENGNMLDPVYDFDRTEEINYVYGAGSGLKDERIEATDQSDDARIAASPINRREAFYDLRNEDDTDIIESAMLDMLYLGKPEERLSFRVQETRDLRYGVHYHLGDKVRAEFAGIIRDYWIMAARVQVRGGRENITIVLEIE